MTNSVSPISPPVSEETEEPVLLVPGTTTKLTLHEWVMKLIGIVDDAVMASETSETDATEATLFLASLPESLQSPPVRETLPETEHTSSLNALLDQFALNPQSADARASVHAKVAMIIARALPSSAPPGATT